MKPVILYRRGMDPQADDAEIEAASKHFDVIATRTQVEAGHLVIGRYSVLPFYKELEQDVERMGGKLINTYRQHQFIADMREWCEVLGDMTPKLYERLEYLPEEGPFVVKGETNSRKHQWNTHMFARTRREAVEVAARLSEDSLIGQQQIYARDYVPLRTWFTAFNGLPITDEYRFFVCNKQLVCGGFYWASHVGDMPAHDLTEAADAVDRGFLREAIERIGNRANFYALDVAYKADGGLTVIEINDGQMSGTSMCTPDELYSGLKSILIGSSSAGDSSAAGGGTGSSS